MAEEMPLDRLKTAAKDKPRVGVETEFEDLTADVPGTMVKGIGHHICQVIAGDVVTVCDAIPAERQDQKVKDLRLGSVRNKPDAAVWLMAPDLHHLIDAAEGKTQPPPPVRSAARPAAVAPPIVPGN